MRQLVAFSVLASATLLSTVSAAEARRARDPLFDARLVTVKAGPKRVLHQQEEKSRACPSGLCPTRGYVIAGDRLITTGSTTVDGVTWLEVEYPNPNLPQRARFLRASDVTIAPAMQQPVSVWAGNWIAYESSIEIKPGSRAGTLTAKGEATWGAHDADRVARGGINTGEIEGNFTVANGIGAFTMGENGTLPYDQGEEIDCRVRMRMLGPYLLVQDNYRCGGMNVSFAGTYVKKKERGPIRKPR